MCGQSRLQFRQKEGQSEEDGILHFWHWCDGLDSKHHYVGICWQIIRTKIIYMCCYPVGSSSIIFGLSIILLGTLYIVVPRRQDVARQHVRDVVGENRRVE